MLYPYLILLSQHSTVAFFVWRVELRLFGTRGGSMDLSQSNKQKKWTNRETKKNVPMKAVRSLLALNSRWEVTRNGKTKAKTHQLCAQLWWVFPAVKKKKETQKTSTQNTNTHKKNKQTTKQKGHKRRIRSFLSNFRSNKNWKYFAFSLHFFFQTHYFFLRLFDFPFRKERE